MPDYNQGKIYSIRSLSRPDLVYIGSTSQSLAKRYGQHKSPSNRTASSQIIALGDSYIELVEEYKCDNKNQLQRREGEIIRSMDCVNKVIPGRTDKEYYIDNKELTIARTKQYQIDNKHKIKQYIIDINADKLKEYNRKYRFDNADKLKEYSRQYNIDNSDKKKEYRSDNIIEKTKYGKQYRSDTKDIQICICGSEVNYGSNRNKNRHFSTLKHTMYVLERQEVALANYHSHF
jgi:hypothetical protein